MTVDELLGACSSSEKPGNLVTGDGCSRGGFGSLSYALYDDIDWDASGWDNTAGCITDIAMVGGAVFCTIDFDPETARYDFVYDPSTRKYTNTINFTTIGKSKSNWLVAAQLKSICGLVFCIGDECEAQRWVGVGRDFRRGEFKKGDIDALQFTGHTDTSGTPSEKARDEFTFASESTCAPFYGTVGNKPF